MFFEVKINTLGMNGKIVLNREIITIRTNQKKFVTKKHNIENKNTSGCVQQQDGRGKKELQDRVTEIIQFKEQRGKEIENKLSEHWNLMR